MATWDDVRDLAAALPEAEESTSYRKPALRVRGKAFAWISPHERGALCLRVDPDERPLMIASKPDVYFVTPHYAESAIVLVRLEDAQADEELRERIAESWLLAAPPALAKRLG